MSKVGVRERLTQQQLGSFFQETLVYHYRGGCKACDGNGCDFSKEGGTPQ